jgi:hypothetical protein
LKPVREQQKQLYYHLVEEIEKKCSKANEQEIHLGFETRLTPLSLYKEQTDQLEEIRQ